MHRLLTRPAALLGALALAGSALVAASGPANAAPGDPVVLTVNIVDQYGRPTPSQLTTLDADGNDYDGEPTSGSPSTWTVEVPGGQGYGFQVISPWAGIECFGVTPCTVTGSPNAATSPVVTVPDGVPTSYTVKVNVLSITGSGTVGSPHSMTLTQGMQRFNAAVAGSPPPYNSASVEIPQQWLRGGTAIAGATGASYSPVRQDGGQSLTARLSPSAAMYQLYGSIGLPLTPLTTNAIAVAVAPKIKTKTKVNGPKRFASTEKVTMTVKVKAKTGTPDGKVTISIGNFKVIKKLDDGVALVNIPRLAVGTYKLKVSYSGSPDYKKSKAKTITLTVTK